MALVHEQYAKAFADIGAIAKSQKNAHHGYAYRGVDDVMAGIRAALVAHQLFYIPKLVSDEYDEWQTSKGGRLQVARVKYEFAFYAIDGTTLVVGPVVGQSADTDDKAPMQATSQSAKVALIQCFCIPVSDAGDGDAKSPVSEGGGRNAPASSNGATEAQTGRIKSLLTKLPPERRAEMEKWLDALGPPGQLSKRDASKAIDRLQGEVDDAA